MGRESFWYLKLTYGGSQVLDTSGGDRRESERIKIYY